MKSIVALALFAIPMSGLAGPITQPVQVVDVEWWGTLLSANTRGKKLPPQAPTVSDYLHGTLRINLALAPPDLFPDDPNSATYSWFNTCQGDCSGAPSKFVTTKLQRYDGASSGDDVYMNDRAGRGADRADYFGVSNVESAISPAYGVRALNVTVRSPDLDFIHGDSMLQQFDISTTAPDGVGIGSVEESFNRFVSRTLLFVVNRLKVTPKVCRM